MSPACGCAASSRNRNLPSRRLAGQRCVRPQRRQITIGIVLRLDKSGHQLPISSLREEYSSFQLVHRRQVMLMTDR